MGTWAVWPRDSEPVASRHPDEKSLTTSHRLPVRLEADWQIEDAGIVPRARIALRTVLVLSSVEVQVSLRTRGGAAARTARNTLWRVNLFPGETRARRAERRLPGTASSGRLGMRVTDATGLPLAPEWWVGVGEGAVHRAELSFTVPVSVTACLLPSAGRAPGRHRLAVQGEIEFTHGVTLELTTSTSGLPARGAAAMKLPLAAPGTSVLGREHALEDGCPAEAWVSAGFVDGRGNEFSDRRLLGRYTLP